MIELLEVECLLYNVHSLKDKRSILKRLTAKLRKDFNVAVAELDYQDLWQRTKLGIVTIANERKYAEQVIQKVLNQIDSELELEATLTNSQHL